MKMADAAALDLAKSMDPGDENSDNLLEATVSLRRSET